MNDNEKDANYWREKYAPKNHSKTYLKRKYKGRKHSKLYYQNIYYYGGKSPKQQREEERTNQKRRTFAVSEKFIIISLIALYIISRFR